MNNLFFFLTILPVNLSEFLEAPFVYAFDPYISLFGNFTWGIIFGFIGAAVYVASEEQLYTTFGYLLLVGIIFSIILPEGLVFVFGLIFAFLLASILYKAVVSSK